MWKFWYIKQILHKTGSTYFIFYHILYTNDSAKCNLLTIPHTAVSTAKKKKWKWGCGKLIPYKIIKNNNPCDSGLHTFSCLSHLIHTISIHKIKSLKMSIQDGAPGNRWNKIMKNNSHMSFSTTLIHCRKVSKFL